jgi:hypothetical protein
MNLPKLGLHELVAPRIVGSGKPVDDSFDDCPCISLVVRAVRGAISHDSKEFAISFRDPRMVAIVVGARSFLAQPSGFDLHCAGPSAQWLIATNLSRTISTRPADPRILPLRKSSKSP